MRIYQRYALNHSVVSVGICLAQNQIIVPASYNIFPKATCARGYALLKCLRCYIVLDILAGLEVHMAYTMEMYAKGLVKFSESIKVCEVHWIIHRYIILTSSMHGC